MIVDDFCRLSVAAYDTISYIINMKVTALIPDDLLHEVRDYTHGKNITDSLVIALSAWISAQKLKNLQEQVKKNPLTFRKNFSAQKVRGINRLP
jgi:hypothetical protein